MEHVIFKNSRNLCLAGCLYPAESEIIIIMCHGFMSDKSSLGRFDRLAESFQKSGFNVLTFDFSGCGESDADVITISGEVDDLQSAVAFAKCKKFRKIAFYGHSLGTLICLKAFTPDIITLVLTGAVTDSIKYKWDDYYSGEQLEELKNKGFITAIDRTGKSRQISGETLSGFEKIEQKNLLETITCPVLIIHPDAKYDWEEQQLLKGSRQAMNYLSRDSVLEIVKGKSHSLADYIDQVIELANKWFIDKLLTGPKF